MVRLNLSPEEADLLKDILEGYLSDLRMKIADTGSLDFRKERKKTAAFLKKLLKDLEVKEI